MKKKLNFYFTVNGRNLMAGYIDRLDDIQSMNDILLSGIRSNDMYKCLKDEFQLILEHDINSESLIMKLASCSPDVKNAPLAEMHFEYTGNCADTEQEVSFSINNEETLVTSSIKNYSPMFKKLANIITNNVGRNIYISFYCSKGGLSIVLTINGVVIDRLTFGMTNVAIRGKDLSDSDTQETLDKDNLLMKLVKELIEKNDIDLDKYKNRFGNVKSFESIKKQIEESHELSFEMFKELCETLGYTCLISIGNTPFNTVHGFIPPKTRVNPPTRKCGIGCRKCASRFLIDVGGLSHSEAELEVSRLETDKAFEKSNCPLREFVFPNVLDKIVSGSPLEALKRSFLNL